MFFLVLVPIVACGGYGVGTFLFVHWGCLVDIDRGFGVGGDLVVQSRGCDRYNFFYFFYFFVLFFLANDGYCLTLLLSIV